MGFFDKLIKGVNRAAEPVQDAFVSRDGRLVRGADVAAGGDRSIGTIVGIRRWLGDETTQTVFTIDVGETPTTPAQRTAVEVTTTRHLHRLRLGLAVPVRIDSRRAVIDWAELARTSGLIGDEPGQRTHTRPPAAGVMDDARDMRVLRRLEKGRPAVATIVRFEPVAEPVGETRSTDTRATITAHRDVAAVTGTLKTWADEVQAGRMKPKAFLKYVAEWEAAGQCTAAEAAAARLSAGIEG